MANLDHQPEQLHSFFFHFLRIHQLAVVFDPVEHKVFLYAMLRWITMISLHEVYDFLPFREPKFILGHITHPSSKHNTWLNLA